MKVYKLIFLIVFVLLFLKIFISIWWYYSPHTMLNLKYDTNLDISNLENNYLIICNHKTPTTDIMIMCNETKKLKNKTNIVAWRNTKNFNDKVDQFFKDLPIYTPYTKIDINKSKKNGKTKEIIEKLKNKENVIIFLQEDNKSEGIYHLLKDLNIPILFTKIDFVKGNPDTQNIFKIFGNKYKVNYERIENYEIKEPKKFMNYVKDKLYS